MDEKAKQALGLRISSARKSTELTQNQLAECIDKSFESISNIERGKTVPPIPTLYAISKCLNVPMQELVSTMDGDTNKPRSRLEMESQIADMACRMDNRMLHRWLEIGKILMRE